MVGFKAFLSLRYVEWAEGLLLAGRVDEARTAAQRGLELATTHGERGSAVWARCALGDIELTAGPAGAQVARAHYEGAREEAERMELRGFLGRCHLGLGRVEALGDDRSRAREHLATAALLYRQAGSRSWLARVEAASAGLD
jgi:hypothetical protein